VFEEPKLSFGVPQTITQQYRLKAKMTVGNRYYRSVMKWLVGVARSIPLARRISYALIKNRAVHIASGAGEGLRFNIAGLNTGYASGTNEMPVQMALAGCIKPGDVFLDIGANIGFFTVIGARLVGPGGRVYTFEPVPENISALKHNIALNQFGHVSIMECALSNEVGKGELLLAGWGGGSALASASPPPDVKGSLMVDLETVDHLVAEGQILAPDVVKIDVEGAELEVLQGMAQVLKTHPPRIVFELDDQTQEGFSQKQSACEAYLKSFGYHIARLDDSYPNSDWIVGNFLAVPGTGN
jgi:FkbM family methyltransferase